jgi:uncharacterized membrane protein YhaH (DUF805 family)
MVGFTDAVKLFYERYTDFAGRSTRSEYWWVQLFYVIVLIILVIPIILSGGLESGEPSILSIIPLGLFILASIIPMIALTIRRFHDQDKSGWFYLLSFIPYIGGIIVIVFMCIAGTNGSNRFGHDPLNSMDDIFS